MRQFWLVLCVCASVGRASGQAFYHAEPDWESAGVQAVSTGAGLVDLDQDGWLDLVVANGNDIHQQRVAVYYNQGDGSYPLYPSWRSDDLSYNGHLDVADVNGDGWMDVAVGLLVPATNGWSAKVYLNNNGTLSSLPDWVSDQGDNAFGVAFGDVNGDGRPDLAVATGWPYGDPDIYYNAVHLNVGGVLETTPSWRSDDTWGYSSFLWVDADDDGWLDLLGTGNDTYSWLYRNLGGVLETTASWRTDDIERQFAIMATAGDVDGDGLRDLFVTDNEQLYLGTGEFRQYTGLAGGWFTQTPTWTYYEANIYGWGAASAVALADVNRDGMLDLACGGWWQHTRLFLNDGSGFAATPDWGSGPNSVNEKIVFGDVNRDGVRTRAGVFAGDGSRRLFYLEHQPIERILEVVVDGLPLGAGEYTYSREHGWVSVGVVPSVEVEIVYTYSTLLDMAVTNWDSDVGNYLYYNLLGVTGDIDGDGDVDLNDFATLALCYHGATVTTPPPGCSADEFAASDLDGDNDVDLGDFSTFALNFTG